MTTINDQHLQDGLVSMANNIGNRQKQMEYVAENHITSDTQQLEALWAENWIIRKICSKKSQDMTRKWREITSNDLTAEQLEQVDKVERQLKLQETLKQASIWASLYGGVGILILTDKDSAAPLDERQTIRKLVILRKEMISGQGQLNQDIESDNYGRYETYQINTKLIVHHSRLIIYNASSRNLPSFDSGEIWGLSDVEDVYATLKRYDTLSVNIGDLVTESKTDVLKIDGLSSKIAAGFENEIAKSIAAVQAIKSSTNTLLIDKDNEYEQKELTFAGLKDLLVEFRNAVAGAADMPVTILFGQSVSGLASGDEDIQNYHESIHALQESRLRPIFDKLDPFIATMAVGFVPKDWWFEFVSLKEMTTEQKVNALNAFATATNTLIQNGVVTELQVANELKESELFANISSEDLEMIKNDIESAGGVEATGEQTQNQTVQAGESEQSNGVVV